ncbi:MAG: exodeoxyribonuclease V subunit beta [Syntrophorhabdaceae bacterium]|nr:exodeoxyribonuclease V subunit beta [Syntrophorhabdaceae bacterium]
MKNTDIFDPLETSLSKVAGLNLVEASAGTGKTYTISSLFVRLLLEFNLNVNDILVITFTNAATNELKERIRARLKDTVDAFTTGKADDGFLERLIGKTKDKEHAIAILTDALNSFDMAAIFTIHGFCLRILKEHAFESRCLFDIEMADEDYDLLWEVVKDFWRKQVFYESKFFLNYAFKTLNINSLYSVAKKLVINPSAFIVDGMPDLSDYSKEKQKKLEWECLEVFKEASTKWAESKESLYDFLKRKSSPKKKKDSEEKLIAMFDEMDEYFHSRYPLPLPEGFQYLYDMCISENTLHKERMWQEHPFFKICDTLRKHAEDLSAFYDIKITFLKKMLMDYVRKELIKRKQLNNIRSFDDLLLDVHRAISVPEGKNLAEEISRRYKAILVDEFQDTDPLQYEIIRHIYKKGNTTVFIIGDPKQSIYSFRGADIFSYIKAANDASRRFTLEFNYRSSERLLKAVNTLFGNIKDPFIFKGLDFKPPMSARTDKQADLIINGMSDPSPLKICFLESIEYKKPIKVNEAIDRISKAIADEIVRLLKMADKGKVIIDDRPLTAKDIAVIARKNEEAKKIQKALNMAGIPGVIYTTDSVFSTDQAVELLKVISAICEPNDESKIKAALITDIMGMNGDRLIEIIEDEKKWNEHLEKFEFYRNLWLKSGFITMARTFILREGVKNRLISMENGERRLTDVLHLIELLHKACIKHRLNIEGALKWLSNKIELEHSSISDEYQLRLETDEEAVKILTIHRSKGLEFPIVFCPFNWSKGKSNKDETVLYHDENKDYSLTIDIRPYPDESSKKSMEMEELAENIRLLYVSLTRAKKRCYLVWGRINQSEDSGLAYILYSHGESHKSHIEFSIEKLKNYMKDLSDDDVKSILNRLIEKSEGTIEIITIADCEGKRYIPRAVENYLLSPRTFTGTIDKTWGIVSFSSLVAEKKEYAELPDRDQGLKMDYPLLYIKPMDKKDIFSFPQGTKAGLFIHDVLMQLDFTLNDDKELRRLIEDKLTEYGFEKDWLDAIYNMVKELVKKSLKSDKDTFNLSKIDNDRRLNELEFYIPISLIDKAGLGHIFDKYKKLSDKTDFNEIIKTLGFSPAYGMMRGFIDMVFEYNGRYYIVDWKSNFLGNSIEDYGMENLKRVMIDQYYFLQYHLYTLALHSLLSFRKKDYAYEKHFGGIFYIFIRGINPKDDCGVFFDLPEKGLIEELDSYIRRFR